jgi:hypothetical protein
MPSQSGILAVNKRCGKSLGKGSFLQSPVAGSGVASGREGLGSRDA